MAGLSRGQILRQRMRLLKISDKDLREEFVCSSGPGGQNVNKVATCVSLTHIPSGETVKCQVYRTQAANRIRAREILVERLERCRQEQRQRRLAELARERARRRRRSVKGKENMLEKKHQRSERKQLRRKISCRRVEE